MSAYVRDAGRKNSPGIGGKSGDFLVYRHRSDLMNRHSGFVDFVLKKTKEDLPAESADIRAPRYGKCVCTRIDDDVSKRKR